MKKIKVLVTYVEAGMGHIVSARAVADALKSFYPEQVEVEDCYLLRDSGSRLLQRHERYLVGKVKSFYKHKHYLNFFFFLAGRIFPPMLTLKLVHSTRFFRQRRQSARQLIRKKPDVVITTHYALLHYAVHAKKRLGADFITVHYNPDPCVHEWNDNRADLMVVNNDYAYRQAIEKLNFTKENCALGAYTLRSAVLSCSLTKQSARQKHGIEEDAFVVVMADGAYASARLKPIAKRLIATGLRFTLIVIAGVNEEIYKYFTSTGGDNPNVRIKVLGYTELAHELYLAADLFITKAGPNAIIDSAYVGTPVMITYHSGKIEEQAIRLIVERYRTGVVAESEQLAEKYFTELVNSPALLQEYAEGCKRFARSCVSPKQVADAIMQGIKSAHCSRAKGTTGE